MSCIKEDAYYEYIYNHFGGVVYATAFRILNNSSLAQDVLQETLCSFFRYNSKLKAKDERTINKWLQITARNMSINLLKKHNHEIQFIDELYEPEDDSHDCDPEAVAIRHEMIEKLSESLDKMDRKYAMVLQMKYYDDLSVKEISAMLDVSVFTIYSRIRRGLKILKEIYERWEKNDEKSI